MSVRQVKVHGRKVWQTRVAFRGLRSSRVCTSREAARTAESELLQDLKKRAGEAEQLGSAPATLRQLFDAYAQDLADRGKGEDTIARAVQTCAVLEALLPEFLVKPVSRITEADILTFRRARAERPCFTPRPRDPEQKAVRPPAPAKASAINRDLRTLRAMLKRVRPDFHFPAGAFFPEDETRVRWLRPDEELTVLEVMPSPFREMAKLAALTLMRQGEIWTLRRDMVHLEQGVVLLPRAKAGARPVILSEAARKIVQAQLESHESELVFPNAGGRAWGRT